MSRLNLRTALAIVAMLAAWCATANVEYPSSATLRSNVWFIIWVAAICFIVYKRGSQRAFWFGLALALTFHALPPNWLQFHKPDFTAVAGYFSQLVRSNVSDQQSARNLAVFTYATVDLLCTLGLGVVGGLIARRICRNQQGSDQKIAKLQ